MKLHFLLASLLLVHIANASTINICIKKKEEGYTSMLSGATVKCWDEDSLDADDLMTGTGTTDSNGCVTLTYTKKISTVLSPCAGWDCTSNPNIYCKVAKTGLYPLYTDTKEDWNQTNVANFGTVTIYPDRTGDPGGTPNGCGPVTLWPGINSVADILSGFGDQCDNHDLCYGNCYESKKNCDLEFKSMMYSKCNDVWDTKDSKNLCKSVAYGMYKIVKDYGADAYNSAQEMFCS